MKHVTISSDQINLGEGLRGIMKAAYLVSDSKLVDIGKFTAITAFKDSIDAEMHIDEYCTNNATDKPELFVYKVVPLSAVGWTPENETKYRDYYDNDDDSFWKRHYPTVEAMLESAKQTEEENANNTICLTLDTDVSTKKGMRLYLVSKEIKIEYKRIVDIQ